MKSTRRRAAVLLGLLATALWTQDSGAFVRATMAIDGKFQDWQPVLLSSSNSISDRPLYDGDPDAPGGANRDLVRFAATWDDVNLYLHWQRAAQEPGNAKRLVLLAYIDRDLDRQMSATDRIVALRFEHDDLHENGIYPYVPAAGADPMLGDGNPIAGRGGSELPSAMTARGDHPEHLRIEVSIPWADLGVAPRTPILIQPAIALLANAGDDLSSRIPILPAGVEDNGGLVATGYIDFELTPGVTVGGPPGATVDLPHRLTGLGNLAGVAEISVTIDEPRRLELWSDPNGDGSAVDGVQLAVDDNGDGDYGDVGDLITPGADTTANSYPDSGQLPEQAVFAFVVRVSLPAGDTNDGDRTVLVTARSATDATIVRVATDIVRAFRVTVAPSQNLLAAAGVDISMPHTVCNFDVGTQDIEVSAFADKPWPIELRSAGVPVSRLSLDAGACGAVAVIITVPTDTPLGTLATISVLAWRPVPLVLSSTTDTVVVTAPLTITPDGVTDGLAGSSVFVAHTLRNATGRRQSYELRYSDTAGGTGRFWTDPDGDGIPDDGALVGVTSPLDGFGGEYRFLVQIELDDKLDPGDVVTSTIAAGDPAGATVFTSATDTTTVRLVATYASPAPSPRAGLFPGCASVYAHAGPLPSAQHRFKWYDPTLSLIRVSNPVIPDADGFIEDRLDLLLGDGAGTWQLLLQRKEGATWTDVVDGGAQFEVVRSLVGLGGAVTVLLTNTSSYAPSGGLMSLSTVVQNQSAVPLAGTGVEYVVFRDADSNGHPGVGETYMQLDGTAGLWVTNARTCRATGLPTLQPGDNHFESSCTDLGPMDFGDLGGWRVYARWFSACDDTIADRQAAFNVGCVASAPTAAGADRLVCRGGSTQLGSGPAEPGVSYLWSPAAFLDDPTSPQPLASPATTMTFSLQQTNLTGCIASDDVLVLVGDLPEADAGPSTSICLGDSVRLGTTAVSGLTYSWSPTAGLDNPASPRPWASPTTTTAYTMTISASGFTCTANSVTVVNVKAAPSPSAGPDGPNPSVIGPAMCEPGVSYSWLPAAGLDDPTACNPLASPSTPTTYCLTAWDQTTGCPSPTDCVQVGSGPCPSTPEAGADQMSPANLGPAVCDPAVSYEWTPTEFLDDPSACNPVATPPAATEFCVRARHLVSGCLGPPDCVIVGEECIASPSAIFGLMATRVLDDVQLSWSIEGNSNGGYRVYRVTDKTSVPAAPLIGLVAVATAPDRTRTYGTDVGAGSAADSSSLMYQVVGVCADGTEGP